MPLPFGSNFDSNRLDSDIDGRTGHGTGYLGSKGVGHRLSRRESEMQIT